MDNDKKEVYDLGLMLKNVGHFCMVEFEDRLIFQKTIYILKSFGIDLGYDFGWYHYGVYSPSLTRAGFKVDKLYQDIPQIKIKYKEKETQTQFDNFLKFMEDKKLDADALELASSICFWSGRKQTKDETVQIVQIAKPHFSKKECEQMWDQLKKYDWDLR